VFDFLKKLKKSDEEEDLSILEELKGEHNINSEIPSDVSIEPANNQPNNQLNPPSLNDLASNQNLLPSDFNQPQHPLNSLTSTNNLLTFANNQPQQPSPLQPPSQPPLNYQNNAPNSLEDEIREIKLKIEVLANKIEKIETKLELIYNLLAYNR